MGYRFLIIIGLATLLGSLAPAAKASPLTHQPPPAGIAISYALKIACGWDYPCHLAPTHRPRDVYWRRHRPREQIYIHNNYGSVTIHVDGRERPVAAAVPVAPPRWPVVEAAPVAPPPCCLPAPAATPALPCGPAPCAESYPSLCGAAPCLEEKPKDDCGMGCWWKRFRAGYCGHGCWSYREQAHLEAEEKEAKEEREFEKKVEREEEKEVRGRWDYPPYYWRPYRDTAPPPPYERPKDRYAEPRYETPKIDERTPLGRYDGPKYP